MAEQTSGLTFVLAATTKNLTKGLGEARTAIGQLEKQTRGLQNILSGLGVGFGLYQLGLAGKDAVNVFKQFEYKMSEVKAITNATDSEFKELSDDALKLGRSTIFTARQVAELQVAYGRLGFSTKEIINATKATLDLAAATNSELADAAEVAGSTLRGFGLDASETVRVTDVMASSFNKSALDIENFRESIKFVAPIARAAGASIEETTALLGVLANAGIKGSIAGTSLRRIFSDLTKDGRPLQERLEELGKRGLTLQGAFDEIGRVAQTSLLVLAKNTGAAKTLTDELNKAAGETERVARIRLDNLEGDVVRLTSAWEGFILALQQGAVGEFFRSIANDATSFINRISGQGDSLELIVSNIGRVLEDFGTIKFGQGESLEFGRLLGELSRVREELKKPIPTDIIDGIINRFNLSSEAAAELRRQVELINGQFSLTEKVISEFEKFAFGQGANVFNFKGETADLEKLISAATKFQEKTRRELGSLNEGKSISLKTREELELTLAVIDDYIAKRKIQEKALADSRAIDNANKKASADAAKLKIEYEKLSDLKIDSPDFSGLKVGVDELSNLLAKFEAEFAENPFSDTAINIEEAGEEIDSAMQGVADKLQENFKKFGNLWRQGSIDAIEWVDAIKNQVIDLAPLISDFAVGISEAFGDALSGEDFGKSFLQAVSNFMSQLGQQMIALGIAKALLDKLSFTLPGGILIAGGVALVAASKAIKNTINQGISGANSGGSSSRSGSDFSSIAFAQDTALGIRVDDMVIRGQDLYVIMSTYNRNNRSTGNG